MTAPAERDEAGASLGAEEPDFYMEQGCVVFTAAYHLRRQVCCGSGCRHCPYWPPHSEGTTVTQPPANI